MLDSGIGNTTNQVDGVRPMPLNATRGCPYKCTFCSNPKMWGKLWRARPVEDVTAEMKYLNSKYGANHFDFTDLTLAVKKSWLIDFCNQMIKELMLSVPVWVCVALESKQCLMNSMVNE